jgi:hypothetical protein
MDSIASSLLSGKIDSLTKDLGNAVGLNEENEKAEAEGARINEQMKRQKELEKRRQEREARHKERESERDKIRAKYELPAKSSSSKASSSSGSRSGRSQQDKKDCVIS